MSLQTTESDKRNPRRSASPSGEDEVAASVSTLVALEQVVEEVVQPLGFELVSLELLGRAGQHTVRIFLDRPGSNPDDGSGGINIADCARMSRIVGTAFDAAEADLENDEFILVRAALAGRYTLEVSSPGIERPLTRRAHFERFQGRRVALKTFRPLDPETKQKVFHGTVRSVEAEPNFPDDPRRGIIEIEDADGGAMHRIAMHQIKRANLVFEHDAGKQPKKRGG